jgi:general secretion pathway protein E
MLASSLGLIVAQRLLRRLCSSCRRPEITEEFRFFTAAGCPRCFNSGYKGRIGVFEILQIDDTIRELIHERASASRIREIAQRNGMKLLAESARRLLMQGVTSREEIEREIGEVDE